MINTYAILFCGDADKALLGGGIAAAIQRRGLAAEAQAARMRSMAQGRMRGPRAQSWRV